MASADPITDRLDLLSDTVYREKAAEQLDGFLKDLEGKLPVQKSQIYGLRQIARQQPGQVGKFADHQRQRAERKLEMKGGIDFWKLVANICGYPDPKRPDEWSVAKEGFAYLPTDLQVNNIPQKAAGHGHGRAPTPKQLKQQRKQWLQRWSEAHIPAFFERFCTHALYRMHCARQVPEENHERI